MYSSREKNLLYLPTIYVSNTTEEVVRVETEEKKKNSEHRVPKLWVKKCSDGGGKSIKRTLFSHLSCSEAEGRGSRHQRARGNHPCDRREEGR